MSQRDGLRRTRGKAEGQNVADLLAKQRQAYILERVRRDGAARVADLVAQLGVSDMTIRRDLLVLESRNLLHKVHGGATSLPDGALFEPGFPAKSVLQEQEKAAIAEAAVALARPGSAIGISAGTTTYALARRLVDVPGLTVVTNSVPVAEVLYAGGGREQTIILTGGVRTPSDALVGPFAVAALRTIHLDLVFMGVHGMDLRSGFTTPNVLEADTDRALVEAGRRLIVVADHTKWGVIGISTIARLDQADTVVTDSQIDRAALDLLSSLVREVIVADVANESQVFGRPDTARAGYPTDGHGHGAQS
jgi:DeoR/GlpR family transcriptional regulator of sugar metabolism